MVQVLGALELQAVGFFLRTRRVNPWLFQRQPNFLGKAGENSPHSLGSIGERESKKDHLSAGGVQVLGRCETPEAFLKVLAG
jgi:hypothetical protein